METVGEISHIVYTKKLVESYVWENNGEEPRESEIYETHRIIYITRKQKMIVFQLFHDDIIYIV